MAMKLRRTQPRWAAYLHSWFVLILCVASVQAQSNALIPNPATPAWFQFEDGQPYYMCAPNDPEDFLYRGTRNADGTRTGDQMDLIDKMTGTGANAMYMQIIRSHGGDGDSTHNPFENSDPSQPLDQDILDQWETWFDAMGNAGIAIVLIIYDDAPGFGSRPILHRRWNAISWSRSSIDLNITIRSFGWWRRSTMRGTHPPASPILHL